MPLDQDIGFFNYGSSRGQPADEGRDLYSAWQKALAEIEQMKTAGPTTSFMPEWRANPQTGQREYMVNDQWVKQDVWNDPEFQAMVADPWTEQEKKRRADEYAKNLAMVQERAAMAQYDYDDYQRRADELKTTGGLAASSYRSPRVGGGGGAMGQSSRRY